MKNNYFLNTGILFLLACLISTNSFAQTQVAVVGALKSGKAVVTNVADATVVLKGGLSASATVTNISIEQEQASGKYFLVGEIGNSTVSGKAVELKLDGGILRAVGGPGIEITCTGNKCGRCIPKFTKWEVRCVCQDANPPSGFSCDMTSKVILTTW